MEVVRYRFKKSEIEPLSEVHHIVDEESALSYFTAQPLLVEEEVEIEKAVPAVLATSSTKTEFKKKGKERKMESTYSLSYFNPQSGTTEIIEMAESIRITDPAEKAIEESVSSRSMYPIYSLVAAPLVYKKIDPVKLQQILDAREYGTPPKFGGPAIVRPDVKKSEIVKYEEAAELAVVRMEEEEKKTLQEIVTFEAVMERIKKGEDVEAALSKLPPLSKARYLALLRAKKISKKLLLKMLSKDLSFLKAVKKKLMMFSIDDLAAILSLVKLKKGEEK